MNTRALNRLGLLPALVVSTIALGVLSCAGYAVVAAESEPVVKSMAHSRQRAPLPPHVLKTPAADVVRSVIGEGTAQWAALAPVPFGCQAPPFVLSATTTTGGGTVGMHVVSAGQGREALDSMASCGWRTSVAGAPALKFSFATGESVMWMRGDVLISLASGDVSAAALEALDAQVLGHLGPVCASLEPTAADATRSPVHPAYAQPTAVQAVTITDAGIPNVDPAAVPVLAELPSMSLPAGVSGPPVPDAVEAPVAPVVPGPQVTSAEIVVPVFDETGPGCGWAFTATKPANVTREGVEKQVADLNTAKSDELTAAQAQWKKDVQAFDDALVSFIPAATAWNEHVEATRVVHMSWANQRAALDAYEVAKRAWDDAVQVRADLIAAQESAERQWLDAQAQCDAIPDPEPIPVPEPIAPEPVVPVPAPEPVPSPSPKPAPSPSPSPSPKPSPSPSVGTVADPLVCPAPRPAVLDQAVVDPGPEPSPPVLWPNG